VEEKRGLVDFHFHTNHSDGSSTVAEAIREAKLRRVKALALTDHNTYKGIPVFRTLCLEAGIAFLEGVEIYAAFPKTDWAWDASKCGPVPDMTILGRQMNWRRFEKEYQEPLRDYWTKIWLPQTLEKLRALGLKVPELTKHEIQEQVNMGVPPVLHNVPQNPENWPGLLQICQKFNSCFTMEELEKSPVAAANRYVYSIQGGAYVLRGPQEFGVSEAVDLAEQMGGALFAAHPGGNYANWSLEHLDYFVQMGGHGIEIWQYYHRPEQIRLFLEYAIRYDLFVSGGSDWHDKNGKTTLGCWDKPENQTPVWVAEYLLKRLP
jgi:hypothetical protein